MILIVNRNYLKYIYWEVYDKDVILEHINITDISSYGIILYMFGRCVKLLKF